MPVKRLNEVPSLKRDNPNPANMQLVFSKQTDPEVADMSLMVVNLYPHTGSTGIHTHEGDEVFVVTSGYGEGVCGDQKFEVGPGTVLYAPKGVFHGVSNSSDQTMQLICFFTPALPDERVKLIKENSTLKKNSLK